MGSTWHLVRPPRHCSTATTAPSTAPVTSKPSSGGQGESVSTQNVVSVYEESPSDQEDQSEGENVNSEL